MADDPLEVGEKITELGGEERRQFRQSGLRKVSSVDLPMTTTCYADVDILDVIVAIQVVHYLWTDSASKPDDRNLPVSCQASLASRKAHCAGRTE